MKGELQNDRQAIQWATDYHLKATAHPGTIYIQTLPGKRCGAIHARREGFDKVVGFCDLEDWGNIKLGLETLLNSPSIGGPRSRNVLKFVLRTFLSPFSPTPLSRKLAKVTIASLASYVSLGDEVPSGTVMLAAALLKSSLCILHAGESTSWINSLPIVCSSVAGLFTSEASTASHA
ncbi:hypothetical protein ACFX19_014542 [Malus domestica]